MDGKVLGFTILIALVAGILFGLAPALQISRSGMYESLKEGSRGSTGGQRSQYARSLLVVSEVAFSLMLLVGAGLLAVVACCEIEAESSGGGVVAGCVGE